MCIRDSESIAHLGKILQQSENVTEQEAGRSLLEFLDFAEFRLADLEQRVRFLDRDAAADVQGSLDQLRRNPDVMSVRWKLIIRACEAFVSISETQRFEKTWAELSEISNTIPESNPLRREVQNLLKRQKERVSTVGRTLDPRGVTIDGQPPQSLDERYSLVVFADVSEKSLGILRQLANTAATSGEKYKTVVAFKDGVERPDPAAMPLISGNLQFASEDAVKNYQDQIPIDFFPEIVLISRERRILATNLSPEQVFGTITDIEEQK